MLTHLKILTSLLKLSTMFVIPFLKRFQSNFTQKSFMGGGGGGGIAIIESALGPDLVT